MGNRWSSAVGRLYGLRNEAPVPEAERRSIRCSCLQPFRVNAACTTIASLHTKAEVQTVPSSSPQAATAHRRGASPPSRTQEKTAAEVPRANSSTGAWLAGTVELQAEGEPTEFGLRRFTKRPRTRAWRRTVEERLPV